MLIGVTVIGLVLAVALALAVADLMRRRTTRKTEELAAVESRGGTEDAETERPAPPVPPAPAGMPPITKAKTRRWRIVTGLVVLAAVGIGAVTSWYRGDPDPPRYPPPPPEAEPLPPRLAVGDRLWFRWRNVPRSSATRAKDYTVEREVMRLDELEEGGVSWRCAEFRQTGGDGKTAVIRFQECYARSMIGTRPVKGRADRGVTVAVRPAPAGAERPGWSPSDALRLGATPLTYWVGQRSIKRRSVATRFLVHPVLGKVWEHLAYKGVDGRVSRDVFMELVGHAQGVETAGNVAPALRCDWSQKVKRARGQALSLGADDGWPTAISVEGDGSAESPVVLEISKSRSWPRAQRFELPGRLRRMKSWYDASSRRWWLATVSMEPERCHLMMLSSDSGARWAPPIRLQEGETCGVWLVQRYDPSGDRCELATWVLPAKGSTPRTRRTTRYQLDGPTPKRRPGASRGRR